MPYIKQEDRDKFKIKYGDMPINGNVDPLVFVAEQCQNAGDLNYAITMILKTYLQQNGENYARHNEIIGMLDCCKAEWYRKMVSPYEDLKEKENGSL
jgi:hypothetical protein